MLTWDEPKSEWKFQCHDLGPYTQIQYTQLELGVYDAVANFNIDRKASILIFEKFNKIPGKYCLEGCRKINEKWLSIWKHDKLEATKKCRKIRRGKAKIKDDKNNDKEGQSYEAGVF